MGRKPKIQEVQEEVKKDPVAEALLALADAVKGLEKKLDDKLVTKQLEPVKLPTMQAQHPIMQVSRDNEMPFPLEWRMIIDEVLNQKFKASVNYRADALFELTISVPQEYSNAPKSHWDLYKEDRRHIVLSNALGAVGVRDYCQKIADNLGKDLMNKVIDDRAKLAMPVHA